MRTTASRTTAGDERVKRVLATAIAQTLKERQLTQSAAARIMQDAASQVSLVVCGHLRGFSVERLMRMLARLGRDVEITVHPRRAKGRAKVWAQTATGV